ncbi:MAG TPA: pyruvate:ferredoxin (flavodoxin) oxidoreductase [Candidatus Omnitrophota bacterium]|mgnify:CR=1 FL=1|nr:pyruvate:ferredoxin (flavodoxin) oxidoreductase [Candidatus Omnitrophota bacterium]
MARKQIMMDGNEAAAHVAFKVSEVIAIYPITPSSNMGEWADAWAAKNLKNIWGTTPLVQEMQSEGGAAGAIHGALQRGALATTFTASQGLLLMIPNMFKISGELTPTVFHIAARTIATHALSIFGDHADVMAARSTGFALLSSNSVQEVMDLALIAHAATLESRVPFVHFFDGFRTSHELAKIELLTDEDIKSMINDEQVFAHRARALSPDNPVIRGTAQNPDVFFQAREIVNAYYDKCPAIVQSAMDKFAKLTGRQYKLFEYVGALDAERVIVMMGSGTEVCRETVDHLTKKGEKVGVLNVRLYRPFAVEAFIDALPKTTRTIAVLDRCKEPGAGGEPMYLDVTNALFEKGASNFASLPKVIGGRYGLSSKEFTPAMVKGVFDEMAKKEPKNHFTVGITEDVTKTSLSFDPSFSTENPKSVRAVFYGLGSDGTVGANHQSIKIIGENTPNYAQGYFVYDSKKSGSMTVSHLRFGPDPIRAPYLITRANFLACHQFVFLEKYDILRHVDDNGVFLLNSYYGKDEVWDHLPKQVQQQIINKKLQFYVIDGYKVAEASGMGGRVNTIMQTCFFAISGVLPREQAIAEIKKSIEHAYGKKGADVVKMNFAAVDKTLENLHKVEYPNKVTSMIDMPPVVSEEAPEFVRKVLAKIMANCGDELPTSAFPCDGTFPTGTTQWEKRNIALQVPVWEKDICIQCGKCSTVCPHAVIRAKAYDPKVLSGAPAAFKHVPAKDKDLSGMEFTLQVAVEDCTGCGLCVTTCPVKDKADPNKKAINMHPQPPLREEEAKNWKFFSSIPVLDRTKVKPTVRSSQFLQPLFEFSGACGGCGETPYIRLVSQLFGDRMVVANATGCTSIYGGNLPTTPWAQNAQGRGPAWSNSLFEDNAEFGLGFRLALNKQQEYACELVKRLESKIGTELAQAIVEAKQVEESDIFEQRQRVETLKEKIKNDASSDAKQLLSIVDTLVKKSVWIMGGDGWAYDIGFGGLDHVLASGFDVNVLVLDTEVYSNTGGQMSKATPRGAVAKFAASGKPAPKKDLARMIMSYGNVYVANVALGARDEHTVKSFLEAEHYPGPSLIIAYSHCIAHGINMGRGLDYQKDAVACGYWPLFRYNPLFKDEGKNPLVLDSQAPKMGFAEYALKETRFKTLAASNPEKSKVLLEQAQNDVNERWAIYEALASEAFAPKKKA